MSMICRPTLCVTTITTPIAITVSLLAGLVVLVGCGGINVTEGTNQRIVPDTITTQGFYPQDDVNANPQFIQLGENASRANALRRGLYYLKGAMFAVNVLPDGTAKISTTRFLGEAGLSDTVVKSVGRIVRPNKGYWIVTELNVPTLYNTAKGAEAALKQYPSYLCTISVPTLDNLGPESAVLKALEAVLRKKYNGKPNGLYKGAAFIIRSDARLIEDVSIIQGRKSWKSATGDDNLTFDFEIVVAEGVTLAELEKQEFVDVTAPLSR